MKIKQIVSDRPNYEKYAIIVNGEQLGYGYVSSSEINPIEIFISENYKSNGYGKFLFLSLLDACKKKNFSHLIFEVENSNYKMIRILELSGALHLSNFEEKSRWIII